MTRVEKGHVRVHNRLAADVVGGRAVERDVHRPVQAPPQRLDAAPLVVPAVLDEELGGAHVKPAAELRQGVVRRCRVRENLVDREVMVVAQRQTIRGALNHAEVHLLHLPPRHAKREGQRDQAAGAVGVESRLLSHVVAPFLLEAAGCADEERACPAATTEVNALGYIIRMGIMKRGRIKYYFIFIIKYIIWIILCTTVFRFYSISMSIIHNNTIIIILYSILYILSQISQIMVMYLLINYHPD